jgi:hypothetical protein
MCYYITHSSLLHTTSTLGCLNFQGTANCAYVNGILSQFDFLLSCTTNHGLTKFLLLEKVVGNTVANMAPFAICSS